MASSDDDEEIFPAVVSDYYFYDAKDEPVSFTNLPVQWSNGERSDDNKSQIYLRGNTDNGLQKVHKLVKAWKYEFLKEKPEILVLSKDNKWIKVQKPRKSFEHEIIRTILITLHCLHFFWRKPKASSKALRAHLFKVFSLYDIRPSVNDLMDHLNFIQEAVKRDNALQKSKFLASLLERRSRKRRDFYRNVEGVMKPSFIVDDKVFDYEDDDSESDDDDDMFDTVCAICDNGGDLTCCEGKCFRSFHATVKSAKSAKSNCKSLGLHPEEVKGSQPFLCLNCSHEQHQCFVCRKLGSSDKSCAEVFCCSFATCGHFYHPSCVAKLLEGESDTEAHNLEAKIASGDPFTCPVHKCHRCKLLEDEKVKGLQFAVCRRCPRSYHRKCLPSKIVFDKKDNDEDVIARAWNNLLPKSRALIYCLKHKMDDKVGTAVRNIKFPEINHSRKNVVVNEDIVNPDYTSDEAIVRSSPSSVIPVDSFRKSAELSFGSACVKKQIASVTYKKTLKRSLSIEAETGSKNDHIPVNEDDQTMVVTENDKFPSLDADSRDRILPLMKDDASPMTHDTVKSHYNGAAARDPYVGAGNGHRDNISRELDTAQQGFNRETHIEETRKHGIGAVRRKPAYVRGQHDSGYSCRYSLEVANTLSSNRFSTLAMNRYTPKLDELNHTWMKNREIGVYDQPVGPRMDASSFVPRQYHPFQRHNGHHSFPRDNRQRYHPFPRHNGHNSFPRHNVFSTP